MSKKKKSKRVRRPKTFYANERLGGFEAHLLICDLCGHLEMDTMLGDELDVAQTKRLHKWLGRVIEYWEHKEAGE